MRGKVLLLRRGTLLLILTALVAAGIFMVVGGPGFVSASAAKRQLPIYSVEREEKVCAISFDAAWGNEDTQMLIDILGKYNVKASFLVVGDWVDKYPESVKQLSDAGMEVIDGLREDFGDASFLEQNRCENAGADIRANGDDGGIEVLHAEFRKRILIHGIRLNRLRHVGRDGLY